MADTLCGTCTRGADECGFMADMLPVPGWEAEKVVYKHQQGKKSYTYAVKECPLFVPARTGQAPKKTYAQKACARCGKEFVPKHSAQKYCGRVCSKRARG